MRFAIAACTVVASAAGVLVSVGAGGESRYRVDAEFDRLSGLVTDQDVRIAGAKVGQIVDIGLTDDRNALIGMEVEEGFAPFHEDARCTIRQDSLLGEKFVQCDPGTPEAAELTGRDGSGTPTVPVERTEVPVDIDLILSLYRVPQRERVRILLTELGVGLSGRGPELSAAIRRANPALREAQDVLRLVGRDRAALRRLVDASEQALGELADRGDRIQSFIERADRASAAVADQRGALSESIRRLPPLLEELEPSADRLASLARESTPALRDLRTAAPYVSALLDLLPPLSDAAGPALAAIEQVSPAARRAARSGVPLAKDLGRATREMPDVLAAATEMLESTRDSGGVEGLLQFQYYAAASSARFDSVSHLLPSYQLQDRDCGSYRTAPREGCSAKFAGANEAEPARAAGARASDPEGDPSATLMDWLLGE